MTEVVTKLDFIMFWGHRGGVENVVNTIAGYLIDRKWEVRIIQLSWDGFQWTSDGLPFYALTTGAFGHDTKELTELLFMFWEENGACDIAVSVGCPINTLITKQAAVRYTDLHRLGVFLPVVSWMHADPLEYERLGIGSSWMLNYGDAFFAINTVIYDYIVKSVPDPVVFEVKNPVNPKAQLKVDLHAKKSKARHRLLFVGRVSPEKGLETIIEAFKSPDCDSWDLDVIGAGEDIYESYISSIIKENNMESRICFHGWKENPWDEDYASDALILASFHEASPLAVVEALANGIPVIATPVGSIPETIIPGKNGYLFPVNDAAALSEILKYWTQGKLPELKASDCVASVQEYLYDKSMLKFEESLISCMQIFLKNS